MSTEAPGNGRFPTFCDLDSRTKGPKGARKEKPEKGSSHPGLKPSASVLSSQGRCQRNFVVWVPPGGSNKGPEFRPAWKPNTMCIGGWEGLGDSSLWVPNPILSQTNANAKNLRRSSQTLGPFPIFERRSLEQPPPSLVAFSKEAVASWRRHSEAHQTAWCLRKK